mmetsp:Transcript_127058/g.219121  ORF Transcript_127058/g.219121 Transcript_127058/m.219121 type:complete len:378 (+) Transcript_127058:54-1187(+)
MKRSRFVRIPRRRETAATRRLRARIARERQGPNGRWESNQKKKEARIAKRKSMKLSSVFDAVRSKRLADEAAAFGMFDTLIADLNEVGKAAQLREMMPRLQGLAVTASLLRKSPSILEALLAASKRCKKSKDASVTDLVASWRKKLQASKPRFRLLKKKAVESAPKVVTVHPPACKVGPAASSPQKPPVSASRLAKPQPSQKLGSMFASLREKHLASEADTVKTIWEILPGLAFCAKASTLRSLLPRLQSLMVTAGVLQQMPSLIGTLESAAKRCRKGKDEGVVRLLSQWRELQKQQKAPEQEKLRDSAKMEESPRSPTARSSTKRPLPLADSASPDMATKGRAVGSTAEGLQKLPPLKQRKITAFLNPAAVMSAGG